MVKNRINEAAERGKVRERGGRGGGERGGEKEEREGGAVVLVVQSGCLCVFRFVALRGQFFDSCTWNVVCISRHVVLAQQ